MKFSNHERSACHKIAVENMLVLPHTTKDIGEMLSKELEGEKEHNRKCCSTYLKQLSFSAIKG